MDMEMIMGTLAYFVDVRFILFCFVGAVAGLFVGAIPGLSVSMATALLVSITYTWDTHDALGTIMGVYVVGVFSGLAGDDLRLGLLAAVVFPALLIAGLLRLWRRRATKA